jgi:hypothetical protein
MSDLAEEIGNAQAGFYEESVRNVSAIRDISIDTGSAPVDPIFGD